ncbi:exodeoxyribonuclease VII large subunit [bacterium]|nr:exodeoxyribonuclease VII large subunit [bacterium]
MSSYLTVSEFTKQLKNSAEKLFSNIAVIGEVSGFTQHKTGHWYFSLKDDEALIQAVFWGTNNKNSFIPKEGEKVKVKGKLAFYPPMGRYQIVISSMEKDGVGELYYAFEMLKERLEKEGLFSKTKKELPKIPKKVALITATNAAALTDFLKIAEKRAPFLSILVIPTSVQGKNAAKEIAENIALADSMSDIDLIVVTRGGGSIEDLWCFNEEIVVRAVFNAKKTVVTAVGHERDTTLIDFVADRRAATPSEAAEIVFTDKSFFEEEILKSQAILFHTIQNRLFHKEMAFEKFEKILKTKAPKISEYKNVVDSLKNRVLISFMNHLRLKNSDIQQIKHDLSQLHPIKKLEKQSFTLQNTKQALEYAFEKTINNYSLELKEINLKLDMLSPYKMLEKGYVAVKNSENRVVTSSKSVKSGDTLFLEMRYGTVEVVVK